MSIVLAVIAGLLAALLYRMGGMGDSGRVAYPKLPKWFFDTKVRDLGIPTIMIGYFVALGHFHWSLLICFFLMFGSLTTYFKKKGTNAEWYNWLFVGLAFSFSMLPYSIYTGDYVYFLQRTVAVTLLTVIWSQLIGKDWLEESGRGFILIASLMLLLKRKKK